MLPRTRLPFPILAAALLLGGCGAGEPEPVAPAAGPAVSPPAGVDTLVASLAPASDSAVSGVVVLTRAGDQLILGAAIDNIDAGEHAIHVHETGDCSAPDATSAGGHFAPGDSAHGAPGTPETEHHAGDFGNFTANEFSQGKFWIATTSDYPLADYEGRAVVVHAQPDDLASQPAGDAGARIACGVLAPLLR